MRFLIKGLKILSPSNKQDKKYFCSTLDDFDFRSDTQSEDSLDGEPIDGEAKRTVSPAPPPPAGAFIKSKWETVDPEQVENLGSYRSFSYLI